MENKHNEYISIKHHSEITIDEDWNKNITTYDTPMYENYAFEEKHDATHLTITMKWLPEEYVEMFDKMRPEALEQLKLICETTEE